MFFWENRLSIDELVKYNEEQRNSVLYIHEHIENTWTTHSFGNIVNDIRAVAGYIEVIKNRSNPHIAICGKNSYNWAVLYLAVMGYTGICFPIDRQYLENDLKNILDFSDMDLFLYDDNVKEKISEISSFYPQTEFVHMSDFIGKAKKENRCNPVAKKNEETACVLFTSGTSAKPKAVMLSQGNLFNNYTTLYMRTPMNDSDRMLLTLPLNHVYAGVAAFLYSFVSGMQIFFGNNDMKSLSDDFLYVKPTVYISVPLLLQRFYEQAKQNNVSLKDFFGGKIRFFYCGGARVDEKLKREYAAAQIPIMEAYGLSETSSVIALDKEFNYKEGSVGKIFENLNVKIDNPDEEGYGEILVKGKSVMSGYFKHPEMSETIFTKDGFLRTGDIGRKDEEGYLFLKGRKKRMVLTANGKNVFVQELEEYFRTSFISKTLVFQEGDRICLKCWYNGSLEQVKQWTEKMNESLPKYKRYETVDFIPDEARIK